ncbi:MAG: ABC transporter ATP-binding protein/permease, partial [Oscillospiraceae bacterium]|nr:ABC transporter ATP-binding protein/permease [Oscillospiraceae bacterium]
VKIETLAITILAFTAATAILQSAKSYFSSRFEFRKWVQRTKVSHELSTKDITTDYANLEEENYSELKWKSMGNTRYNNGAPEQIYNIFTSIGTNICGFVIYIALLASVNPFVLLLTAVTSVFGVVVRRQVNNYEHEHDSEASILNWHLFFVNNELARNYTRAKDIRVFSMVGWIFDVYNAGLKLSYDFSRRVQARRLLADMADCAAAFLREGIAYAYLVWQVLHFGLAVDDFVLMFSAIGGFSVWVSGILTNYSELYANSLNYCRIREFLDYPEKFKYENGEPILQKKDMGYAFELKNVSFKYSGAEEYALKNINLKIRAGEKLAVVGLNGAGKTTLVKLLCGFYDPTEGEILLNGKDIRDFNRRQYYDLFTAVFQDFNILPLSIAENISQLSDGSNGEEAFDGEKMRNCIALADLEEKIRSLPAGTASMFGKNINEEAIELSGGEMQKLMLARALYKESPIMILDEPTAALDPIAEDRLYKRYSELSAQKTSVYISHRLASTRFCDRIVLLDYLTIAEIGTHDELIKLGGKYAELFAIQSKYYKEEAKI